MFNVLRYLRDFGVKFVTKGADVGSGWVGIRCPFTHPGGSRDHGTHGGFNLKKGYYHCWICGWHSLTDVIMALERCEYHTACQRIIEYSHDYIGPLPHTHGPPTTASTVRLPPGTMPLQDVHKTYLQSRGFNPDELEAKYKLMGTLGAGPYAGRIIIPIFLNGVMVSYQGRDITNKNEPRYKACQKRCEIVHHKHTLYNLDNAAGDSVIIVEGVADVWRLGDGTVATFGTEVTQAQIAVIAARYRRVTILFDAEESAQRKAAQLQANLIVLGIETIKATLSSGDPADLCQADADKIKRRLL